MAEAKSPSPRHSIQHYLVPNGQYLVDSLDIVTGSSVLLTPENSPAKDADSKLMKKPTGTESLAHRSPPTKAVLSRSHSDTQLNSPKPPTKVTKSSQRSEQPCRHSETTEQSQTAKALTKGKSRSSRSRKVATKTKAASEKTRNSKSERRASSVPGKRNTTDAKPNLLTDYFPIRRSARVPSKDLKKQQQSDVEQKILNGCEDGLKVVEFPGKGRGVVSTKLFSRGDFVVEYKGDIIDLPTAKRREKEYTDNPEAGCYMYYFNYRNKSYCVDATAESPYLGRLLNHSKANGNCATKVVGIDNKPYLILVATRDISIGEELLYDYGDRSKSSLEAHPWLAL